MVSGCSLHLFPNFTPMKSSRNRLFYFSVIKNLLFNSVFSEFFCYFGSFLRENIINVVNYGLHKWNLIASEDAQGS